MKSRSKLASIIIVNYNGKDDTLEFLESLKKTDYPNYEIIVVDNASTDGSVAAIKKKFPKVKIVKNKKNITYAGGLNSGIKVAKGKYIVTLNNDMIAHQKSWLSELVKVAESDKKIGLVKSLWVYSDNPNILQQGIRLELGKVSERILEMLGGTFFKFGFIVKKGENITEASNYLPEVLDIKWGNGLVKREVIEKVGLFDGKMLLYFEEVDFAYRVRGAGYRIVAATKSRLKHKGGKTIIKKSRYFGDYHFYRNKLRFMLKNYDLFSKPFAIMIDLLYYIFLMIKYSLKNRFDRVRALRDAIVWNVNNWRDYMPSSRS